MSQSHSPDTVHMVRMIFIEAARGLTIRALSAEPNPGHRLWDEIVRLARIARDMARANERHPGPQEGSDREWETLPRTYLERNSYIDPEDAARRLVAGERTDINLAEQILTEGRVFLPGGLSPGAGGAS